MSRVAGRLKSRVRWEAGGVKNKSHAPWLKALIPESQRFRPVRSLWSPIRVGTAEAGARPGQSLT
jgi:hypothetical protein